MSYDPDQPSYNTPISPRQFIWNTPEERAAGVNNDGIFIDYGYYVSYGNNAVCPALWINLES